MIRNSLFISNFSKAIKIAKRAFSILMVLVVLFFSINILNRIYFEEEPENRILWKSFYEQDNIDNVFIGSSHVYCDVNPFILDEINGKNNFDLSVGSLTVNSSYYLLKEVDRVYDLSDVYVELYYVPNTGNVINQHWRSINYLKPSPVKLEWMFEKKESSTLLESLIPFIRYRSELFNSEFIKKVHEQKNSENWKNYKYIVETDAGIDEYMEKGFWRTDYTIETANAYLYKTQTNLLTMSDYNCEYLRKIMTYCKKNNIKLKFFISPIYETQILSSGDYDAYYRQVLSIAQEGNIELYDFNLCKAEYLDIMHQEFFSDNGHLNETGASIYTPFLWKVLSNSYEDNKDFFCDSYDEKISLDAPELYGIYYEPCDAGKNCTFASNTDSELEYAITYISEEGESVVLQDFSDNKNFLISDEISGGKLHAEARIKNTNKIVSAFDIKY